MKFNIKSIIVDETIEGLEYHLNVHGQVEYKQHVTIMYRGLPVNQIDCIHTMVGFKRGNNDIVYVTSENRELPLSQFDAMIALKSFFAGIAEVGLIDSLRQYFLIDHPVLNNDMIAHQLLGALMIIYPDVYIDMLTSIIDTIKVDYGVKQALMYVEKLLAYIDHSRKAVRLLRSIARSLVDELDSDVSDVPVNVKEDLVSRIESTFEELTNEQMSWYGDELTGVNDSEQPVVEVRVQAERITARRKKMILAAIITMSIITMGSMVRVFANQLGHIGTRERYTTWVVDVSSGQNVTDGNVEVWIDTEEYIVTSLLFTTQIGHYVLMYNGSIDGGANEISDLVASGKDISYKFSLSGYQTAYGEFNYGSEGLRRKVDSPGYVTGYIIRIVPIPTDYNATIIDINLTPVNPIGTKLGNYLLISCYGSDAVTYIDPVLEAKVGYMVKITFDGISNCSWIGLDNTNVLTYTPNIYHNNDLVGMAMFTLPVSNVSVSSVEFGYSSCSILEGID